LSVCVCFSTLSGERHELRLLLVRLCDVRASISDTPTRGAATSHLLRGAATSITYHLRGAVTPTNYYYVTRLQPTTSYYDAVIRLLLLLLHGLQGATSIYDYTSTTNYYYAENQSTTSLLLCLTTCRVHKLLLCGVPPVHFVSFTNYEVPSTTHLPAFTTTTAVSNC